jgi:hypothetical protein
LPGKLQTTADYLDAHLGCSIVYHEADVFDHESGKSHYHYSRDHYNARYVPRVAGLEHLVRYGCFLNASSVMFRRHDHLIDAVDARCKILLDYPLHIINVGYLGGSIDRIDDVLGRYRLHSNSACGMNAQSAERRLQVVADQLQAVDNARQFGINEVTLAAGRAHHRFAAALYFLRAGDGVNFSKLIRGSACDGWFFDDRHQYAYKHANSPDVVRKYLGWE